MRGFLLFVFKGSRTSRNEASSEGEIDECRRMRVNEHSVLPRATKSSADGEAELPLGPQTIMWTANSIKRILKTEAIMNRYNFMPTYSASDIYSAFYFTWILGLAVPILIRYAFLERPVSKTVALLIAITVYLVQLVTSISLGNSGSHTALLLVVFVSLAVLNTGYTQYLVEKNKNINPASNLKIRDIIFNKKTLHFWLLLIVTALLIIASLSLPEPSVRTRASSFHFFLYDDISKFIQLSIFCVSFYFAFLKYKENKINSSFLFVVIGVVFNPFFLLSFSDRFQNFIEFITAVFFGYFVYMEYKKLENDRNKSGPANITQSAWK